ncbi:MAG: hypothetical protein GY711_23220 [bacterium]|nr:hypothetical protein [bacterium]
MALRHLLTVLLALTVPSLAGAQIYEVTFKTEKAAKKLKKHLVTIQGKQVLVGEAFSGVRLLDGKINYQGGGKNEFVVPDPKNPGLEPYKFKGDERVPASRKHLVSVAGKDIKGLRILMRDETLSGLANEYRLKEEQLADLEAARDEAEKGSTEWQVLHQRYVSAMERLHQWLSSTCFSPAADKLAKDIKRQKKEVRGAAVAERRERALGSFEVIEPHERLVELSEEVSGGSDVFRGARTEHLTMYYIDTIPDNDVEEALRLGEEIIDDFRTSFVDPYLSDDYPDLIPDKVIQAWIFVPESQKAYEAYTSGFWGVRFTENREERLKMSGGRTKGSMANPYRSYWKVREVMDLPALVCHDLGHTLAGYHYSSGGGVINQDWLSEAVGYHLSFEFLGRNGVTCKAFDSQKAGYVKRPKKRDEGEKTVGVGRRDIFNEVALLKGRPIDQVALRDLYTLEDADLAKAWSFFDYIARKEGEGGQRWLRSAGKHANDRSTFIKKWRADAAAILEVPPAEAFKAIEERWRAFAEGDQDTK